MNHNPEVVNWYELNRENVIVAVGGDWDDFALKNGGDGIFSRRVTGRNFYGFISGDSTRAYLDAIFFYCSEHGIEHKMFYRCDGPSSKRLFQMKISPSLHGNGHLMISHTLVREEKQSSKKVVMFEHHFDQSRCSCCGALELGGEWRDTWAIPKRELFVSAYGICPKCIRTNDIQSDLKPAKHLW